tara:strand:- start:191 stop:397 length:207 start_codon:yes stop_codon:yes gene_type:complete
MLSEVDKLVKLDMELEMLFVELGSAYTQMKRYEDGDADKYFFHAGVHANVQRKIDDKIKQIKEVKNGR